ncbi:MAG TPA: homoserine kinase [Gemmatimonadaceae bacterium]
MSFPVRATAFAPGSIGNIGPGLDILGCAVEGAGDSVTAEFSDSKGISILDPGHPSLTTDPTHHSSGIAGMAVIRRATQLGATTPAGGISLRVRKGLPLSAGQGGSAASAVAGAAAVNALIGNPLSQLELLEAALFAETQVAGRHLDNIAPSLLGGIVLVRSLDPIDVMSIPVPPALRVVLATPDQSLRTADARAVLPVEVSLHVALHQAAQVAGIVAALYAGDLAFLGRCIDDRIAEPARAALLPGFTKAKHAALGAGALGVSISGAGPTAFALCGSDADAYTIAGVMVAAYEKSGLACTARVAAPDLAGARIETATPA